MTGGNSMASNTIRFSGLASGMDTDSVVKAMLMPQQSKIDRQKQQEVLLNWKKDAWKDMNNKINTFYSKYISKLRLESTFGKNIISNSNTSALNVDPSSNIPAGIHKIEITNVATSAYMQNAGMSATSTLKDTNTLKDLGVTVPTRIRVEKLQADGTIADAAHIIDIDLDPDLDRSLDYINTNQLNGTGLQLEVINDKIKLTASGSAGEGVTNVKLKVISNNPVIDGDFQGDASLFSKLGFSSSLSIKEGESVQSKDFSIIDKNTRLSLLGITSGTITVNSEQIHLANIGNIGELESAIKAADNSLNVNFDIGHKRFFISSKETGENAKIEITDSDSEDNNLKKLGLFHEGGAATLQGIKAEYTYNGATFYSQSNVVTVNGIRMTLLEKTTQPITISGTKDLQAVADFMKEFVEQYNTLLDEMNTKVSAKKSYKYSPLTDAQKADMKEGDIKNWEDKIKEGLFSNDPQLKEVTSMMRGIVGSAVSGGNYKTLAQVGLTTGNWKEKGKLIFDEEKFKNALEKDSEALVNLFTGGQNDFAAKSAYLEKNPGGDFELDLTDQEKANYLDATKGIATRLYEKISQEIRSTTIRSYGSFYNDKPIDDRIKGINERIYTLQKTYENLENTYYKKFTAMEKMMSQFNNQSNWLTAQLGGM